jgi:hypothetical protein
MGQGKLGPLGVCVGSPGEWVGYQMGWIPVSPHGINPVEPFTDALAMAASGLRLYVAAYNPGFEREAELWSAEIGDEHWVLVGRIPEMRRPEIMVTHGADIWAYAFYIGGVGLDGQAKLVRFHRELGMRVLDLPVEGGSNLSSLLTVGPYLFLSIDRPKEGGGDTGPMIWRTERPEIAAAWSPIAPEISAGRPVIHSIKLGQGRGDEILVGTGRETPGGGGGTGVEVWRGTENGSRWERLMEDGWGDAGVGAVPALQAFRGSSGGSRIYASAMKNTGSTVYKLYPGGRWSAIPYGSGFPAPIRSMAVFERRLFIAEGNRIGEGARLFYTMGGYAWAQDGAFGSLYDFRGTGGEIPIGLHALTPAYGRGPGPSWRRQPFLYMAVQYRGSGVRIWRRALDLWDSLVSSVPGAVSISTPRIPI